MSPTVEILRLSAFSKGPGGGNPAGVVLAVPHGITDTELQRLAAEVGYSETVFVVDGPPSPQRRTYRVRYFSPATEVPFCGHATVALAAALGRRIGEGRIDLLTPAGLVQVGSAASPDGHQDAWFRSVEPSSAPVPAEHVAAALAAFGWDDGVLDPRLPPAVISAGATHLLLPLRSRSTLRTMAYDFDRLAEASGAEGWVTVDVTFMESPVLHYARNAFPGGGVVEDPATGSAAAAYAGYLLRRGVLRPPCRLEVRQGEELGRPSRITVSVPDADGPVLVGGAVCAMASTGPAG